MLDGCNHEMGFSFARRICAGFPMSVYALMLSMSHIVVSANVDGVTPPVYSQHNLRRPEAQCTWSAASYLHLNLPRSPVAAP